MPARQDAPHRGAAEGEALVLLEQLGEVGVVGARVACGGEARHGRRDGLGDGVVRAPVAIAVGKGLGADLPVGAKEPASVAFAEVHQLRRLPDRDLLGDDAIEYMEPCLSLPNALFLGALALPGKGVPTALDRANDLPQIRPL